MTGDTQKEEPITITEEGEEAHPLRKFVVATPEDVNHPFGVTVALQLLRERFPQD